MTFEFNCEEFARQLTDEASKYVSENLTDDDKEFVLECFYGCALRSTRVLSQDKTLELSNEDVISAAHIIMGWIFKITVALVESDIPKELRHGIILDIGYVAFDITKDLYKIPGVINNQIFNTVEYHVINKLKSILETMIADKFITEKMRDVLLAHTYICESEKRIEFVLHR